RYVPRGPCAKTPCAASKRNIRSSASAASPVCLAIAVVVAPSGPTASAAPQSAMTCRQRAAMWARERSETTLAGLASLSAAGSDSLIELLARCSLQIDRDAAALQVVVV